MGDEWRRGGECYLWMWSYSLVGSSTCLAAAMNNYYGVVVIAAGGSGGGSRSTAVAAAINITEICSSDDTT